jgi:hypothetical protein
MHSCTVRTQDDFCDNVHSQPFGRCKSAHRLLLDWARTENEDKRGSALETTRLTRQVEFNR